jgi:hypothetical protein
LLNDAGAARGEFDPRPGFELPQSGDDAEETMRKSLVLALMAIGGGASYAAAISTVGSEPQKSDPTTWRFQVSSILDQQRKADPEAATEARGAFSQRHERYSPLGVPYAEQRSP